MLILYYCHFSLLKITKDLSQLKKIKKQRDKSIEIK
jgi:hypothetical protein